jgi:N-acetylglucosaminyl-diphospho-decaprenol L-rhamnosyltransferase
VDLSIIVVNWNTRELLRQCLRAVQETIEGITYEVIVVDNGSTDGSREMLRAEFPGTVLIENVENQGFARANNQGIRASRGRYILLLNSDAVLRPGAAARMIREFETHPTTGVVGARLLNPDGSFQASYADFPTLRGEFLLLTRLSRIVYGPTFPSYPERASRTRREVDWVFGACLMIRRTAIETVGLLDEEYFMYTEETDWCFRVRRAGWSVVYLPDAEVVHWSGQSAQNAPERKRSQLYRSKWLFLHKHRGAAAAFAFHVALIAVSWLKLAAWLLRGVFARGDERQYSLQQVRSYRLLLGQL